jgi:hypothetical protein
MLGLKKHKLRSCAHISSQREAPMHVICAFDYYSTYMINWTNMYAKMY